MRKSFIHKLIIPHSTSSLHAFPIVRVGQAGRHKASAKLPEVKTVRQKGEKFTATSYLPQPYPSDWNPSYFYIRFHGYCSAGPWPAILELPELCSSSLFQFSDYNFALQSRKGRGNKLCKPVSSRFPPCRARHKGNKFTTFLLSNAKRNDTPTKNSN